MTFIQEILQKSHLLIGLVLSDGKNAEFDKIKLRLVKGKSDYFQAEKFKGDKVFHQNFAPSEVEAFLTEALTVYLGTSLSALQQEGFKSHLIFLIGKLSYCQICLSIRSL